MKKEFVFSGVCLFLILILIKLASCTTIEMKDDVMREESVIGSLEGAVLSQIELNDFIVKRNNVVVPVEFDIKKLNGKYYFYFISPKSPGNYTLHINDVNTYLDGSQTMLNLEKDFTVNNNLTEYNVNPGILYKDGLILIFLFSDKDRNIVINYPTVKDMILKPGKNELQINLDLIKSNSTFVMIGEYSLPYQSPNGVKNYTASQSYKGLRVKPSLISGETFIGYSGGYEIKLSNEGNTTIKDIRPYFDKSLFSLNPSNNISLKVNESILIELTLNNASKGQINEEIVFESGNYSTTLNIELLVLEGRPVENNTILTNKTGYKCSEKSNGRFCSSTESCDGTIYIALDGQCCIGVCKASSTKSSSKIWIGILLAAIAVGIVAYVVVKYKKVKPKINPVNKEIDLKSVKDAKKAF